MRVVPLVDRLIYLLSHAQTQLDDSDLIANSNGIAAHTGSMQTTLSSEPNLGLSLRLRLQKSSLGVCLLILPLETKTSCHIFKCISGI